MARRRDVTVTVWDDCDLLVVEARVWPGTPGTLYRRNGDPGDPPEPAEVEVLSVTRSGVEWLGELPRAVLERVEAAAIEACED